MYGLLAFVSLIATVAFFYLYLGQNPNILYLILAIVFLLATVGLGGVFLSSRVNKKEDIHITE